MIQFFLKLMGARADEAIRIVKMSISWRGGASLAFVALGFLGACGLVYWTYWRMSENLSSARKYILSALRLTFLLMVLLLLVRPMLIFIVEESLRRKLVLLLDNSASMKIADPRTADADLKRAAIGMGKLGPRKGLEQTLLPRDADPVAHLTRLELLKGVFKNPDLNLFPPLEKDFDFSPYAFGQNLVELNQISGEKKPPATTNAPVPTVSPEKAPEKNTGTSTLADVDRLNGESPLTAIGDSIRQVIGRKRGLALAGVFLVTDGANNNGLAPREAAAFAKQEGVPLYIYGIGITTPKDIIVTSLFAQEVAFVKDEVDVTVRVRGQGLNGKSAKLLLKLGDEKVDETEVQFTGDSEQVVAMKFTPKTMGEFNLHAVIEPLPEEVIKDNNSVSQHLRVVEDKIKVLLVEQTPRWDFKYLLAKLLRDRRIDVKCVLFEADPSVSQGENTPYLAKFPEKKEDLFKFDLVILGDVDPHNLTPAQLDNLGEFVSKFGGAVMMIAGKRYSPWAYSKTVLEKMLPVEFEAQPADAPADKPIALELTAAGKTSPLLRLANTEEENVTRWKQMPPVFWVARVSRAKPAAEVLLVDPDPLKATRFGKMPVMAIQHYGMGQVLFMGTDNTWRWRKNQGEHYHTAMWSETTQRMALPHLLGASKRTQLSADKSSYLTGDRVSVYARLYQENYEPVIEPTVKSFYGPRESGKTEENREVILRPVPEQPGMYRGEFVAPTAGLYKFFADRDKTTSLDLNVIEPKYEWGETAMNETVLKEMAATSGGEFFREETLYQFPELLKKKAERVKLRVEGDLWSSPFYFLVMLLLVSAEWILRKRSQLK